MASGHVLFLGLFSWVLFRLPGQRKPSSQAAQTQHGDALNNGGCRFTGTGRRRPAVLWRGFGADADGTAAAQVQGFFQKSAGQAGAGDLPCKPYPALGGSGRCCRPRGGAGAPRPTEERAAQRRCLGHNAGARSLHGIGTNGKQGGLASVWAKGWARMASPPQRWISVRFHLLWAGRAAAAGQSQRTLRKTPKIEPPRVLTSQPGISTTPRSSMGTGVQ